MYFIYRKRENIDPIKTLDIEKIKIPEYEDLQFKHILVATRGDIDSLQMATQLAFEHKAFVTAIYVIEVPFSVSFNTPLIDKMQEGELALKQAEAVAREKGVKIQTKLIRSRSIPQTILDLAKEENADVIILSGHLHKPGLFNNKKEVISEILKQARCRVYVSYAPILS
jgi:APA family basic amino acid/polyamine antiporter